MRPVGVAALALLAWAGAASLPPAAQAQEMPASWTRPAAPFSIADQLHYVGSAGLPAYLLTSDAGHVLIDGPMEVNVPLVLSNVRALGFDPADVRVVLASHAHFDHVAGVASLVDSTGAELVLSEPAAEVVAAGGRTFVAEAFPFRPATADRTVGHLETVSVGDLTLTAHVTPGHTRGCTSWSGTVTVEGEPVSFVSVCSLTVLPMYRLTGPGASYPGIAADYCRSHAHLATLEPDVFLAAHGSWYGLAEKRRALEAGNPRAFVDVERTDYRRYLADALSRIEARLAEEGHEGGCAALLR